MSLLLPFGAVAASLLLLSSLSPSHTCRAQGLRFSFPTNQRELRDNILFLVGGPPEPVSAYEARHARHSFEDNRRNVPDICKLDRFGNYGALNSANNVSITYNYEIETNPTKDQNFEIILAKVERAIGNKILPQVLGRTCVSSGQRALRQGRSLGVAGISALPDEFVLDGVECEQEKTDNTNNCAVVAGEMRLYLDDIESDERSVVLLIIRTAMNNGEFNRGVDDAIVNITFRDSSIDSSNGDGSARPKTSNNDDGDSGTPAYAIPLIATSGLIAVAAAAAALMWKRKKNNNNDESDEGSDEESLVASLN